MQSVLNKAVRFIHCNEQEQLNTGELHIKYNIAPLNISNFHKAQKIWETIRISENEQFEELVTPRNNSHTWFPRNSNIIRMEPPHAIITRQFYFISSFYSLVTSSCTKDETDVGRHRSKSMTRIKAFYPVKDTPLTAV